MFAQHIINLYLCSQITISNTIKLKKMRMKKILLSLFAMFAVFATAFADNVTVSWNSVDAWETSEAGVLSYTQDGYTLAAQKNNGSTAPAINPNFKDLRVYAKGTLTVSTTGANMTQITFNLSSQAKKRQTEITASTGSVEINLTDMVVIWKGDAKEVSFTVGDKATLGSDGEAKAGQFCIKDLIISTGGDTPVEPVKPEAKGDGTQANPFNAVAATDYTNALEADVNSENVIYIKGIVSNVGEAYNTKFGNATFSISEDGSRNFEFLVYRALYLDNVKYADETKQNIKVGDEVVVCGNVVNFKGNTPETVSGKAYLYSLKGNVTGINPTVVIPVAKQSIYSIDGRKLNKLVKGVNIVNGKKVIK